MTDEIQVKEVGEDIVLSDDSLIPQKPTGITYDKKKLLDNEKTVQILGLMQNRWGDYELMCELDNEETRLKLSNKNLRQLSDLFGSSVNNLKGQYVKVIGKNFEGNEKVSSGITLYFYK